MRVRVGVLQHAPVFGDAAGNLRRIAARLHGARADLWVLPELCATGYQFRSRAELLRQAEPADGPTGAFLAGLSRRLGAWIVAGFPERSGTRVYNSALLAAPSGLRGVYRKVHLFGRETRMFSPGGRLEPFPTPFGRLGILVCYDWRFPEAARTLALRGARLIAHPSNLVRLDGPDALRTRALENRVFIVTADRTGAESRIPGERLRFTGASQVAAPDGRLLFRMGREAGVRTALLDLAEAADKRLTRFNHVLKDRRPAAYLP